MDYIIDYGSWYSDKMTIKEASPFNPPDGAVLFVRLIGRNLFSKDYYLQLRVVRGLTHLEQLAY